MEDVVPVVLDRLRAGRSTTWLRIIDDARLDEPAVPDSDAADVVEPYRWLLERVGGGLTLTQAGYLPPAVVAEMTTALGWDERFSWMSKGNREEHARPVMEVRASATRLGLLRLAKGRLSVTKAGQRLVTDPIGLWWHIARGLPDVRDEASRHAGVLVLLLTAAGRPYSEELVAVGLKVLGWVDQETGRPIPRDDVGWLTRDTYLLLEWMDLLPERWPGREAPPSPTAVTFARAAVGASADAPAPLAGPQEAIELTVTLRDVEPPIWRRLVVPASLTLAQTHEVLQTAMGWQSYHLHSFDVAGVVYGDVEDFDDPVGEEDSFTLADARRAASSFSYDYDFGDGWTHDVVLGSVTTVDGSVVPHLVDGARACPPEDCGGPWGYQRLLEVLADPANPERYDLLEWVGGAFDAEAFDLVATNANMELFDRHTRRR